MAHVPFCPRQNTQCPTMSQQVPTVSPNMSFTRTLRVNMFQQVPNMTPKCMSLIGSASPQCPSKVSMYFYTVCPLCPTMSYFVPQSPHILACTLCAYYVSHVCPTMDMTQQVSHEAHDTPCPSKSHCVLASRLHPTMSWQVPLCPTMSQ